jgi:hypothetical protein
MNRRFRLILVQSLVKAVQLDPVPAGSGLDVELKADHMPERGLSKIAVQRSFRRRNHRSVQMHTRF